MSRASSLHSDHPRNGGPPRHLYGRRKGRPLRATRQRLVEDLLPTLRVVLPTPDASVETLAGTLDLRHLFSRPVRGIWLEIGFGAGEHLSAQAQAHPDIGFIGCEPFLNGVAKLLQQVAKLQLDNVRILMDDARLLLRALPAASIDRAFVLFPDPWPKKRHHRRRIIGPNTLGELARVMADGAELRAATDHDEYARWILAHTLDQPGSAWIAESAADWRSRPADWPPTRYEAKALAAGRNSQYFRVRRQARHADPAA